MVLLKKKKNAYAAAVLPILHWAPRFRPGHGVIRRPVAGYDEFGLVISGWSDLNFKEGSTFSWVEQ